MNRQPPLDSPPSVGPDITSEEEAEERRLWADYYEALAHALEILRREGTGEGALSQVLVEDKIARRALDRIRQIRRTS
jgi:hypothetical protein